MPRLIKKGAFGNSLALVGTRLKRTSNMRVIQIGVNPLDFGSTAIEAHYCEEPMSDGLAADFF